MLSFVLKRLGLLIPTFFGIALITFGLIRMIPGDPVEVMMGERRVDPVMHAEAMHRQVSTSPCLRSISITSAVWLRAISVNRWSHAKACGKNSSPCFPATVELSAAAMLFAIVLGLLAGVLAAIKRGSIFDHGVMGLSLTGFSMPIFWWGLILIMFSRYRSAGRRCPGGST